MFRKVRWFVKNVGLKLWEGAVMEDLVVNSVEELEELYTMHIITYAQYINIKKELQEDSDE